jgi:SsrA-binding protein
MQNQKNKHNGFISTGQVAENRRARFDYAITETFECGIVLTGSEVKSLRLGKCNITNGFVAPSREGEIFIHNLIISEYIKQNEMMGHKENRIRKLLLSKRDINKLIGAFSADGMTIVPLKMYFNDRGRVKVLIGIGKGKKQFDKRETIKKREWDKSKARVMNFKNK